MRTQAFSNPRDRLDFLRLSGTIGAEDIARGSPFLTEALVAQAVALHENYLKACLEM